MKQGKQKTILIELLTPDMTLAMDITKPNGDLIFAQDGKLTESIIERLKRFGVQDATILVDEADERHDPEDIKREMKEIEEGLDYRFRKIDQIPLMVELKEIISEHLKGKLIA